MEFGDLRLPEDDGTTAMMDDFDWEHLLSSVPEEGFLDDAPSSMAEEPPAAAAVDFLWIEEIEQLLMNDNNNDEGKHLLSSSSSSSDGFVALEDLLLDSPEQQECSPEVCHEDKSSPSSELNFNAAAAAAIADVGNHDNGNITPNFDFIGDYDKTDAAAAAMEVNGSKEDDDTDDDPASKKRKRQLRNRDAAMRSRERKKMYVKDLEVKSRYLEAECRRLGRLLQCCYAENQMLRISLQSGTMAKPESAVLLLESLLLGSLVWFMALMCLFPRPILPLLSQDVAVPMGSVEDRNDLESAAPRRRGTKVTELWLPFSFLRSKSCKASRTKMKSCFDDILLFV